MFRVKLLTEDIVDYTNARWLYGDLALIIDGAGNKSLLFLLPDKTYAAVAIVEQLGVEGNYYPFNAVKFVADMRKRAAGIYKIRTEGNE